MSQRVLVLPGDGIGPEVIQPALDVLEHLAPDIEIVEAQAGRKVLEDHGHPLPPRVRDLLEEDIEGILFGATTTRPGEPSAVLGLRNLVGAHASVRPVSFIDETGQPASITVYRELSEGLYVGDERRISDEDPDGTGSAQATEPASPAPEATASSDAKSSTAVWAQARRRFTRQGVQAFASLALEDIPEDTTPIVAHKATVLPVTDGLFLDTIEEVAQARGRAIGDRLVDALAHDIALEPTRPRTILAPNQYGDILSDMTAGLHGGLGLAGSITLGEAAPIAEPVHGSAPDIAGRGEANPTGMLRSLALLLDELDRQAEARSLERAIHENLGAGRDLTPDLGGSGSTQTFANDVLDRLDEVLAR